jgi:arylsulfatase A-like enzyme
MMNFFDPHLPYDPGSPAKGLFTADYAGTLALPFAGYEDQNRHWVPEQVADRNFVAAAYDEEVRYLDGQLDRLLQGLAERGLSEQTLVIVVSDHGEEFFEHGSFEHGHSLYDEVLRVPLLMLGPGIGAQRLDTPVSITDLFPTILEALELEIPPGLAGQSLWPLLVGGDSSGMEDRALIAEVPLHGPRQWALLRWPWKVVVSPDIAPRLFNLAQDPGEKINRAKSEPERMKALTRELGRITRQARDDRVQRAAVPLDAETRRQLEKLGYLKNAAEQSSE